jgi:Arc/MetJ family transcription regulator
LAILETESTGKGMIKISRGVRMMLVGLAAVVGLPLTSALVYSRCMSRTNIDIDDAACAAVMERYHLDSKREAVNLALRRLAAEPLELDEARGLRGSGWEGDLDGLRLSRAT